MPQARRHHSGADGTAAPAGRIEGRTWLSVGDENIGAGPGRKATDRAFYNPAMALNRDLSVALVQAYANGRGRGIDVADALAGTGARSIRLAHEVDAEIQVHANDGDPKAIAAIERAAKRNGVADRVWVRHGHAHGFLASRRFDVVDIDPYGSPTPFLDSAIQATRNDGLLCITATDAGALAGTYPRVCRRRYGAHHGLHKAPFRAEVGLRILAGAAVLAAGRFDRAAIPVMSVWGGHWMRIALRIQDGRQAADRGMKQVGHACLQDGIGSFGTPAGDHAGPLWTGALHERAMVAAMQRIAADKDLDRAADLLAMLVDEADAPPFWVDLGDLRSRFGTDAPRRRDLMARLHAAGFQAVRTHLDPQGIRTDAGLDALRAAWEAE